MTDAPRRKLGRPPSLAPKLTSISVTLDAETIARAQALGNGSVSAGIRAAFSRPVARAGDPLPEPVAGEAPL